MFYKAKYMAKSEVGLSKRFIALILCGCMMLTMLPPITVVLAQEKGSGEPVMLSGFAALPQNIRVQNVPLGVSSAELNLPDTLEATAEQTAEAGRRLALGLSSGDVEQAPAAVTVEGVTWESAPEFDGNTEGTYIFTAVLPEGYVVEDGVAMPEITVTVAQAGQSAADKVIAMIDALPSYAELTADPPAEETPEYEAWLAKTKKTLDEILAAKAAYDALTDEEKAQIDEARTAKLLELAELAEQMASIMPMAVADIPGSDCTWEITPAGMLILAPKDASGGILPTFGSSNSQPWYSQRANITSVRVERNVKAHAESRYLFYGLAQCIEMDISELKTTGVTNMSSMFSGCKGLNSIDVSKLDTTAVKNMSGMFEGCSSLQELEVGSFNTVSATTMGSMFADCSGLTTLNLINFDTAKVTTMSNMFRGCSKLSSLTLGDNFNTEMVTNMSNMFERCSVLPDPVFNNSFNTAKVTNMSKMFYACRGLTTLGLSKFNTAAVTNMSEMFTGCSGLDELNLSSFNTEKVTDMGNMFGGCKALLSITFGDNFKTANVTTMITMFSSCAKLTSLDVSKFNTANVTDMSKMFNGCSGLDKLDLSNFVFTNVTDMINTFSGCNLGLNTNYYKSAMSGTGKIHLYDKHSAADFNGNPDLDGTETGVVYLPYAITKSATTNGSFTTSSRFKATDYQNYFTKTAGFYPSGAPTYDGTKDYAQLGETVAITLTPTGGAMLESLTVTQGGATISTTPAGNNKYTFPMPAGDVTVTANFIIPKCTVTIGSTTTNHASFQEAWTKATGTDNTTGATVKLLANVTSTENSPASWPITLNTEKNVTIDLNGFDINRGLKSDIANGHVLYINNAGASLTLTDTGSNAATTPGRITGGYCIGTETTANGSGVRVGNGVFNLEGGEISGNTGGIGAGVYVYTTGVFNMSGGVIKDNTAEFYSGGVHIKDSGKATLTGGKITGNVNRAATYNSGGVGMNSDYVTIGGTIEISGNTAADGKASNLFVFDGKTFKIVAGFNPTAKIGIRTHSAPAIATPIAVTGANTDDLANYFVADNSTFAIQNGTGNVVQLAMRRFTVTLNGDGGTGTDLTEYTYSVGATLPPDWTKTGYAFKGWYDNAGLTGNAVTAISTTDTGDKEYWAKWVDETAPTVSVSTPPSDWQTAVSLTVTFADGAGVTNLYVTVDSGAYTAISSFGISPYAYVVSTEGEHTYQFKAEDAAGNSTVSNVVTVKLDTQVPTLTVTGGETGAASLTLTVASTFGASGGKVTVNGTEITTSCTIDTKGIYTFTATSNTGKTTTVTKTVHSITFDSKGGSAVTGQLVIEGGTATKPADPTRAGFAFKEWRKVGESAAYDFATKIPADNVSLEAVWTLNAPTVSLAVDNASTTYNGGEAVATLTATPSHSASEAAYAYEWYKYNVKLDGKTAQTLELKTVADSGKYTVKVIASYGMLVSTDRESNVVEVAIAKADTKITTPPSGSGLNYGQSLNDSRLEGGVCSAVGSFAWTNGTITPAVSDSIKTEYSVTFTPADTANYNTSTTTVRLAVGRKQLTPSVNTVNGKTYDGGTDATGTIKLDGAVFNQSPIASGTFAFTDKDATENKRVNVSGIVLTGTWGDNYALDKAELTNVPTTAEIIPKTIGLVWSGHENLVYTGNPVSVTATATELIEGDVCIVNVNGGKTDAGTHTATATAVSNSNYKLPSPATQNYTIAKAPVTFAVSDNTHDYDSNPKKATVTQTAGETPRIAADKFAVSYEKGGSAVADPTAVGVYNILAELTDTNFKHKDKADSETEIQVGTLTINGAPYPNADTMTWPAAGTLTYGQKLSDSALTGGSETASGTYVWKTPADVPSVKNDGCWVVFTPTDTNYSTVEKVIDIVVAKATPTLTLPTAAGITYGKTLADSTLSGGSASTTYNSVANTNVPGRYTWTTPATMPAVSDSDSTEYGLTFTPTDTDNYNAVTTGNAKLAVGQKPVGLTWAGHTALVYNGAPVSVTATATELIEGDVCIVNVNGGKETNAGTHTASAASLSNNNYVLPLTGLIQDYTIAKAPVTFAVTKNVHDYDGDPKAAAVTQTAGETPDVSGKFTVSYAKDGSAVAKPTAIGTYDVLVTLTDANFKHKDKADSETEIPVGTLTINGTPYPNADTMTWPAAGTLTYGQKLSDSALTGGSETASGTYVWKTLTDVPSVKNDGCWVVFTPTDTNYSTVEKVIDIVVAKATATLTLPTAAGITYGETLADSTLSGGSASTTYNSVANTNVPGEFKWTVPATMPAVSDSGNTEYGLTFTPTDTDNYNAVTTGNAKLAVGQKPVGLTWAGHTALVYSGTPVSVTATATELIEGDVCIVNVNGGKETNAGTHTATAASLSNNNYALPLTGLTQDYTIAKAPVTFAVTKNVHDYDGDPKAAAVTQTAGETPRVAADKFTVSYEKDGTPIKEPTDMGIYNVFVKLTDTNFKHKGKADSETEIPVGTLTINGTPYPNADTMTWPTAANITYGQTLADSALTGGSETASGTYVWKTLTDVPSVKNDGCWVEFEPADENYATVEHTVSIKVAKATPTLTLPTAAGITYGKTLADSTLSGGSASAIYNGADKAVPGRYTWTTPATMPAVSDSDSTEYGLTFTPTDTANYNVVGTGKIKLAVDKKAVGLTWAGHTALVYSGASVSVTATATGLVGSDACTVTVTDGGKTDAGTYTAKATAVGNPNYKLPDSAEQAYTIAKKPIKVLWSDLFPTYDGTQKYPTLATEGVLNGEDCTAVSTGSAAAGNAGRYKVAAALQGARSGNYTIQNPGEILVIQPAPVSVTLSDYSYKYDGTAKYATVTATPNVPLTVTYRLAGNAVAAPTEEGVYDIFVALDGKNYRFADGSDGKARRMGALTIYKEKPPELFTITFDKGAEDAAGTPPTLPPSVRDTVHILPGNSFLRAGHAFVGWMNGNTLYQPGERFIQPANNNTVFTAQWEAATYDIGGVVDQDGKPVANVRVTLMRGAEQVAETVTNQIGEYRFDSVLPGLYNLVASKPSPDGVGDIIMTIMAEVKASDVEQANITLPGGKTNSIVEVAPGTPKIIVGNLDRTFQNTEGSDYTPADKEVVNKGGTVEIKFIAEEKQKSEIAGDAGEITKEAGNAKIGLYLALNVEKTVTQPVDPGTPEAEPPSDTTAVPETSVLLESVIPLPNRLQGKQSYTVYRVHEGTVDSLTTGASGGERIEVSEDKTTLTLYARKYSTYAIAYTEKSSGGDNGGDDGDEPSLPIKPELPKPVAPVAPIAPVAPVAPVAPIAPVAPVVPAPGTDAPKPAQPDNPKADGADKGEQAQKPNGGKDTPKDVIRDMPALIGGTAKPFVVASALFALAAVLLAVFALLKRSDKRRKRFTAIFAAFAVAVFLLTTGWSGFALANGWTSAVAAFTVCAAMGVFVGYSKEEEQPQTK